MTYPSAVDASCRVWTPDDLADALVARLSAGTDATWLEPSCGEGAFLRSLSRAGVDGKQITAIELDSAYFESHGLADTTVGTDFFTWARSSPRKFDRVVANPPYLPLSRVPEELRVRAISEPLPLLGRPTLLVNYWALFVCRCLSLLEEGGSLGFVLPAAWDYADYASALRSDLPGLFRRFEVYRCQRPLFADVQEGSVVIFGEGYLDRHQSTHRYECASIADVAVALRRCQLTEHASSATEPARSEHARLLSDVATIRIGAVTGDVDYFLLTEEDRRRLGIPMKSCVAVLSRARHLCSSRITDNLWNQLRLAGERVIMFRPDKLSHPAVQRYLQEGSDGKCNLSARKVRGRDPWYIVPLPETPHAFLSGMSRHGPWMALNETRKLSATNTLYTVRFRKGMRPEARICWSLMLLTTPVREQLRQIGRTYADGLVKYEPSDLGCLMLPEPDDSRISGAMYAEAIQLLLDGKETAASQIADRCIR